MTAEAGPSRFEYVPALDGMRAVAVVAVMLFHQGFKNTRGGFLGVDLFFVLSGYLITSLLLAETARAGGVGLVAFWGRRARRLLPALFVMIGIYVAYLVFVHDPVGQYTLRDGLLATLFFVKNYWDIHRRYTSQPAHMWTLSLEEQFYVVWPLAFTALLWLRRRWRGALYVGTFVLFAGSVGAMWFERGFDYTESLEARAQTLLLGALLAVVLRDRAARGVPLVRDRAARVALEALGIAALVAAVVAFSRVDFYTSAHTLAHGGYLGFAAIGAVLIVAASQPGSMVLGRVLSLAPLRFVGRLSYGLYLFHLPIYAWLDETRTGLHGKSLFVLRAAVSLAVATASYYLLERPIRERRVSRRPLVIAGIASALVACVAVTASTVASPALAPNLSFVSYDRWFRTSQLAKPGYPRVLVAGDAIASPLLGATLHGSGAHSVTIVVTDAYCSIEDGDLVIAGRVVPTAVACKTVDKWFGNARSAFDPDVVLLAIGATEVADRVVDGRLLRVGSAAREREIDASIDRARVALAGDRTPMVLATTPCADQPGKSGAGTYLAPRRNVPLIALWLSDVYARYAARHSAQVKLVDLRAAVCPGGRVGHAADGTPYVASNGAFTREGSQFVLAWIDAHAGAWIHQP